MSTHSKVRKPILVFCFDFAHKIHSLGNEDDYIIISLVRTKKVGFLKDNRRSNVLLSRCKTQMIICTNRNFIRGAATKTLVGRLASHFGHSSWIPAQEVVNDNFSFIL